MSLRQLTTAAVLALASFCHATKELPASNPIPGTDTVAGCFNALGDMKLLTTWKFNTQGWCSGQCRNKELPVAASYAKACYCGTKLPNQKNLVDDSKCNEPCPGFGEQACGGLGTYTVYNTGVQVNVAEADYEETSTSTSATPTPTPTTSTTTVASETSAAPTETKESENNGSSPNTVGIAVGVVVGVLAAVAIAVGSYFFVRRRRNAELEEEHRRNAAVNAFISGGKAPSSSNMSIADSRMDPVFNRRMSDGSIADNQDYSRRILRVTNA